MVCITHTFPLILYWQDNFIYLSSFQCFFLIGLPGSCLHVLMSGSFYISLFRLLVGPYWSTVGNSHFNCFSQHLSLPFPAPIQPVWHVFYLMSSFVRHLFVFSFSLNKFSCCLESFPPFSSKWEPSGALFGMSPTGFGWERAQGKLPASCAIGWQVKVEQQLLLLPLPPTMFVTGKPWLLLQLLLNSHPSPFLTGLNWGWGKGHINNKSINF